MQAKDLRIEELVDFSAGLIQLQGRRLILHDIHAFAQFRKDLLNHYNGIRRPDVSA